MVAGPFAFSLRQALIFQIGSPSLGGPTRLPTEAFRGRFALIRPREMPESGFGFPVSDGNTGRLTVLRVILIRAGEVRGGLTQRTRSVFVGNP
jgi:hypothetical protein